MKEIGERLKTLREGVKLPQSKMAETFGTRQPSLARYETGQTDPPLTLLVQFADYFDVSMDYIFARTDKPQGKLYEYRPRIGENNPELKQFIEMCFEPNSAMNERLKQTLIEMLGETTK